MEIQAICVVGTFVSPHIEGPLVRMFAIEHLKASSASLVVNIEKLSAVPDKVGANRIEVVSGDGEIQPAGRTVSVTS